MVVLVAPVDLLEKGDGRGSRWVVKERTEQGRATRPDAAAVSPFLRHRPDAASSASQRPSARPLAGQSKSAVGGNGMRRIPPSSFPPCQSVQADKSRGRRRWL